MRILVTGGAGFIGSNFIHYVLEETSHSVVTLDALTYAGSKSNLDGVKKHPRHRFVEGDIRDEELVNELTERSEAIVNFAAETHVDRSIDEARPFVETNIVGTQVLLDAAVDADIQRFVQISTDEVYGEAIEGSFSEDDQLNPRNPYAATKASADHLTLSYHTTHNLPVMITRSSNNYGPRQHSEKLIPKFLTLATQGESLPLYGDGSNVREWTYVFDNCRAIETVLNRGEPGEIYNIGSDAELTNLEVTKRILDEVDASENLIEFVEDRPGHDQRYSLDSSKIRDLGWEPQWSFEEGLRETVKYHLD